jgi:DNA-binding transcriptional MerR regulator
MEPVLPVDETAGLLSVAETAARLSVSPRTLRYYEELGFITPSRTAGGHRLFGPAEITTLERIGRMQALGFSLATIRKALRYRSYRDETTGRHRLALEDARVLVAEARVDADALRARIAELRREIVEATRELEGLDHDVAFLEGLIVARTAEEEQRGGGGH